MKHIPLQCGRDSVHDGRRAAFILGFSIAVRRAAGQWMNGRAMGGNLPVKQANNRQRFGKGLSAAVRYDRCIIDRPSAISTATQHNFVTVVSLIPTHAAEQQSPLVRSDQACEKSIVIVLVSLFSRRFNVQHERHLRCAERELRLKLFHQWRGKRFSNDHVVFDLTAL
jgi:hypothetical protein